LKLLSLDKMFSTQKRSPLVYHFKEIEEKESQIYNTKILRKPVKNIPSLDFSEFTKIGNVITDLFTNFENQKKPFDHNFRIFIQSNPNIVKQN
jgi:hypothetical protein